MSGFRKLGQPLGDHNSLYRLGNGNIRQGFNWVRRLTFEAGILVAPPTGFDLTLGAGAGSLSVSTAAAMRGTYGYSLGIIDTNARAGRINLPATLHKLDLCFLFDVNSLIMANNDDFPIMVMASTGAGGISLIISLKYTAANGYQIYGIARNDAGATITSPLINLPDQAVMIEIKWKPATFAGANDGMLELNMNGGAISQLTNLDNDTHNVTLINVGPTFGLDAGTNGTIYYDNIFCSGELR